MLASIRKRQASPPEQAMHAKRRAQELVANRLQAPARSPEDHHQIRVQTCCDCAKMFSTPHTLLCCPECDHTICTRCLVDDSVLLFPQPGLVIQRYEDMNKEDGDRNLEMGLSMFRRDQEHEMSHNAEEEEHQQELRLQPQPQPTGKQRQVETGVPSKRSLNMNKCERCRLDKKKCLPVHRVWPTKCDLCIKKGFSCSESKRAVRSTKHAPATTTSPMNTTYSLATSVSFEERLKQWTFLLSYRKMILAAENRLVELENYTISLFPLPRDIRTKLTYSSFAAFCPLLNNSLNAVLREHSTELFTLDPTSQNIPSWFLATSLNQHSLETEGKFVCLCSECVPAQSRSRASGLESSQDTCGELLLLQNRMIHHGIDEAESWQALVHLSHEVRERASEIFESYGFHEGAEWAKSSGVYHPDELYEDSPGSTEYLSDCLGRSQLHHCMDNPDYFDLGDSPGNGLDISKQKDWQDILGRTPLLVACQRGWYYDVEILLGEKADPGLATIYGSLPLHYAAAKGSHSICKLLLRHKTRFDIKTVDCVGKTALDYATQKNHQKVVDLLSAEYAVAHREEEELRRARSLEVGAVSYEVLGSYDV